MAEGVSFRIKEVAFRIEAKAGGSGLFLKLGVVDSPCVWQT